MVPKDKSEPGMQWVCDICGYVHDEEEPPDNCPVCGAPRSKFSEFSEEDDILGEDGVYDDDDDEGFDSYGDDDESRY